MIDKKGSLRVGRLDGRKILEVFFLIFLVLYPLRHVTWGGDLWDIGYNYGNFEFGDVESMGRMWFFSTYLANQVGHVLTLLPMGHTLVGLNVYTGLFSAALAWMGYWFCTRVLGMSPVLAVCGEWIALSMCWCPTALLYNYLTYVLFLACVIFLYLGLKKARRGMLILAGVCLGMNVFVRFSNLPEMGLILAVWAYSFWEGVEGPKEKGWMKKAFGKMAWNTALCLIGYLGAVAVCLLVIGLFYGLDAYVDGISLLFSMTESATDYKPTSMLYGLFWPFKESFAWLKKMVVFLIGAWLFSAGMDFMALRLGKGKKKWSDLLRKAGLAGDYLFSFGMAYWLFMQREDPIPNFTTFYYTSYDPIFWPGTLFLMLAMGIGAIEVIRKGNRKEARFLGVVVILVLLLTSIGSNNGIYPSLNNLFVAAPYVLWKMACFTKWSAKNRILREFTWIPERIGGIQVNFMPVSILVWTFVIVCFLQFGMFGALFSFCEGTGQQERNYEVRNNEVLKGIGMSAQRAEWLEGISSYANDQGLRGRRVILHGGIPAAAFYLQMKPALHSWNDLASFGYVTMQLTIDGIYAECASRWDGKADWPVIIAERKYAESIPDADGIDYLKWGSILDFMKKCSGDYREYRIVYENEKFVIWDMVETEGN